MEKMIARNNKMYYINENANLDPPKEITKLKNLFNRTIGNTPKRNINSAQKPTRSKMLYFD